MELPYCVFDVSSQTGKFVLSITSVDMGAHETLERGGLTADFNAKIEVKGITADIKCWLTIGNLYSFYSELQNCYSTLVGTAVLRYYSEDLTNISVDFSRTGLCEIYGVVKDSAYSKNGVMFGVECDQTYITPNIKKLKMLFDELAIVQGFFDFQY